MYPKPQPLSRCPVCKKAVVRILGHPRGFWETRILALLGLKPFRCPECRARFLGTGTGVPPEKRRRRTQPSPAPTPPPSVDFQELLGEIRESEDRYGLGARRLAGPSDDGELERRERALLRAEPGAPDDVVDAEILDPLPGEDE